MRAQKETKTGRVFKIIFKITGEVSAPAPIVKAMSATVNKTAAISKRTVKNKKTPLSLHGFSLTLILYALRIYRTRISR